MAEYIFHVEHTIEAESEEEAREGLQKHLNAGNLTLDNQGDWLLERDPDFAPDAIEGNEYVLCIKCQASKAIGLRCPECGNRNE